MLNNGIWRNGLIYQAIGTHNNVITYRYAHQDSDITSNPTIISNRNFRYLEFITVNYKSLSRFIRMIMVINFDSLPENGVTSNVYATETVYRAKIIKKNILMNYQGCTRINQKITKFPTSNVPFKYKTSDFSV